MQTRILRRMLALSLSALIVAGLRVGAAQTVGGACDGSAVVDVGDGHFLNATDEDNVIRLYKHGVPDPVREFSLSKFLEPQVNKKGVPKEVDIEAVARIGTRLYWIGSHGRDKKGDREQSRHRLFCTSQTGQGAATKLEPVGRLFAGLLRSFASLDAAVSSALRAAESLAPEKGGINIEDLGAGVDEELLIGFRSPLIQGKALIIRLRNPAAVIERGAEPTFAGPVLLDLGGFGIRAIEPNSDRNPTGYWLLAGPLDDVGQSRLYEWQVGAEPTPVRDVVLPKEHGAGEGLMVDVSSSRLLVSMDGGHIGTTPCKDRPIDTRAFVIETVEK